MARMPWISMVANICLVLLLSSSNSARVRNMTCHPLVFAHRGASGYVPEHTIGSYVVAINMGADYIEPDLVITKDGHLVARHENIIDYTTDVSQHPNFAHLNQTKTVNGVNVTGWFTEDFTLHELKTLKAVERISNIRPINTKLDKVFTIPTFQEIIEVVKSMQIIRRRTIGISPEIKYSTYFKQIGLPLEERVIKTLHENGYRGAKAPVYIQSYEVNNLKELRNLTDLKLMQLYKDDKSLQPFDQKVLGTNLTYRDMATSKGLRQVAQYATAVGPHKRYIIPRVKGDKLGHPSNFVKNAHAAGLKVHAHTFRAENIFLPSEFRGHNTSKSAKGNLNGELKLFLAAGIDGLFTDQPDIALRVCGQHGPCL